ncbi:MAG: hypothetical protein ACWA41_06260 [Putridiphycobacter sp.]
MRTVYIIVFFISNIIGYSQEHSSLFEKKCILENKVYKVVEYDPTDSLMYFNKYPNGYYSIYDKYGRMVESNHYSPYEIDSLWIPGEFKNYYLYDSLDNKIGFIQIHENMDAPFRFIELKSFDKENNKVKIASLETSWKVNSNFHFKEIELKEEKQYITDTVVLNPFHKQVYFNRDTINYLDLFINKDKLIDSTIYHGTCSGWIGKHDCETKIIYEYYTNGVIKKKTELHFQLLQNRKLYSQHEYFYLKTGLLDKITSYYTVNERKGISKFKYYYRKN